MSENETQHYNLPLWEAGDKVGRGGCNGLTRAVDAALRGVQDAGDKGLSAARRRLDVLERDKCVLVTGVYTGDGASRQSITLGFQPKAVVVEMWHGGRGTFGQSVYGGMALPNYPLNGDGGSAVMVKGDGFQVVQNADGGIYTNMSGHGYRYLAVG